MRFTPVLILLLWGLLVSQCVHAEEPNPERPHWIIIATIIDRNTGERVQQGKLGGRELEFNDPVQCKSIIEKVQPIKSDRVAAVLTCRKVDPAESSHL
jgi:hypothetical protein